MELITEKITNSEQLASQLGNMYLSQSLTSIQKDFTDSSIKVLKNNGSWNDWAKNALKFADQVTDKTNQDIVNMVVEIGKKLPDSLQQDFKTWANSNLISKLEGYFANQMALLSQKIDNELSKLDPKQLSFWQIISGWVEDAWKEVSNTFGKVVEWVGQEIEKAFSSLYHIYEDIKNYISEGLELLKEGLEKIVEALEELIDKSAYIKLAVDANNVIVKGLEEIDMTAKELADAFKNDVTSTLNKLRATNAVKSFFGNSNLLEDESLESTSHEGASILFIIELAGPIAGPVGAGFMAFIAFNLDSYSIGVIGGAMLGAFEEVEVEFLIGAYHGTPKDEDGFFLAAGGSLKGFGLCLFVDLTVDTSSFDNFFDAIWSDIKHVKGGGLISFCPQEILDPEDPGVSGFGELGYATVVHEG
ncbi:hypothetical protein [Flammeovirga sp. SubArs3]|uniref:hypothetical protein n=1 Tax=Flammeovirga sp. SubArs3 TaxID=2995316 RepID=UPI00248C500A|nr:hypothetical protein [Flammeovirga sp. SubArs3]